MPSLTEEGFHSRKLAHSAIEEKKSLKAGSSLLVLSIALLAQVRTPTFSISLFYPPVNLVQGAGAHTVCNTDFFLLLELHRLQPKNAESCSCHRALRLALISSTSWGKEEATWKVGTPKSSCQEANSSSPLSTRLFHLKSHYQITTLS